MKEKDTNYKRKITRLANKQNSDIVKKKEEKKRGKIKVKMQSHTGRY